MRWQARQVDSARNRWPSSRLPLVGWFLLAVVSAVHAQGTAGRANGEARAPRGTTTTDARGQVESLFAHAQQASSLTELTRCIQQAEGLKKQRLDAEGQRYLAKLQAWLLNRRGEAYAELAAAAVDAANHDQATQYEEQAIADYTHAFELQPHWRPLHNRGISQAMLGQYAEAVASFTEAIESNPQNTSTRFNRAELFMEQGKLLMDEGKAAEGERCYAEAEKDYAEVIRLDPQDAAARMGRAHAHFYLGQFDAAIRDFDECLQVDANNAVAYTDRADLYAYLGRWEQAARDYRVAIQLDKSLGRAYQSAAWLMATCPEERFRDPRLALRAAQRAIDLDGTADYRYLDTLAAAQASSQNYLDAIKTLNQALHVAPEDVAVELRDRLALYQAKRPFRDTAR